MRTPKFRKGDHIRFRLSAINNQSGYDLTQGAIYEVISEVRESGGHEFVEIRDDLGRTIHPFASRFEKVYGFKVAPSFFPTPIKSDLPTRKVPVSVTIPSVTVHEAIQSTLAAAYGIHGIVKDIVGTPSGFKVTLA